MDLQGFTTIDEVGDDDEICDKEVRTDTSKSFSPSSAAEEIDYLNKMILDIEKDIVSSSPLPNLNIETELLIQTDSNNHICGDKSAIDFSDNSISKISVDGTNVPFDLNNFNLNTDIQLESFSKEKQPSLDNQGIVSDILTNIAAAENFPSIDLDNRAVEVKQKKDCEPNVNTCREVNSDLLPISCEQGILEKNNGVGSGNFSEDPAKGIENSNKSIKENKINSLLADIHALEAKSSDKTEIHTNLSSLILNIKAEPEEMESIDEVDFGDYFNDPAEEINLEEIGHIKQENVSGTFINYSNIDSYQNSSNFPYIPKVHFKIEIKKYYSREQVAAALLMAQSSLASVINMDMFNNLNKSYPFVSITKLEHLTPLQVHIIDHKLIDKFFHKYGTNPKKWKKFFKKRKSKRHSISDINLENETKKIPKEMNICEKRSLEIKTLKERYREAMNKTLARSTQHDNHCKTESANKSLLKSQLKAHKTNEKTGVNAHLTDDKSVHEKSKKRQYQTSSRKQKREDCSKEIKSVNKPEIDSTKLKIEIDLLKKQMDVDLLKKQIEIETLKGQMEKRSTQKQLKICSKKKQMEIDLLKKQMEIDLIKKQLELELINARMESTLSKKDLGKELLDKQTSSPKKLEFGTCEKKTKSNSSKKLVKESSKSNPKTNSLKKGKESSYSQNKNEMIASKNKNEVVSFKKQREMVSSKKRVKMKHIKEQIEIGSFTDRKDSSAEEKKVCISKEVKDFLTNESCEGEYSDINIKNKVLNKTTLFSHYNLKPCLILLDNEELAKKSLFKSPESIDNHSDIIKDKLPHLHKSPNQIMKAKQKIKEEKENFTEKRENQLEKLNDQQLFLSDFAQNVASDGDDEQQEETRTFMREEKQTNSHMIKEKVQKSKKGSESLINLTSSFTDHGTETSIIKDQEKSNKSSKLQKKKSLNLQQERQSFSETDSKREQSVGSDKNSNLEETVTSICLGKLKHKGQHSKDSFEQNCDQKDKENLFDTTQKHINQRKRTLSSDSNHSKQSIAGDSISVEVSNVSEHSHHHQSEDDSSNMLDINMSTNKEKEESNQTSFISSLASEQTEDESLKHTDTKINLTNLSFNNISINEDVDHLIDAVSIQNENNDINFDSNKEQFSKILKKKDDSLQIHFNSSSKVKENPSDDNSTECSTGVVSSSQLDKSESLTSSEDKREKTDTQDELNQPEILTENFLLTKAKVRELTNIDVSKIIPENELIKPEIENKEELSLECNQDKVKEDNLVLHSFSNNLLNKSEINQERKIAGKIENKMLINNKKEEENLAIESVIDQPVKEDVLNQSLSIDSTENKIASSDKSAMLKFQDYLHHIRETKSTKWEDAVQNEAFTKQHEEDNCEERRYLHKKISAKKSFKVKKCSVILEDLYFNKLYRKKIKKEKKYWAKIKECSNINNDKIVIFGSSKSPFEKEIKSKKREKAKEKSNKKVMDVKEEKTQKESSKIASEKSIKNNALESIKSEKKKLTEVSLFGSSFK